GCAPVAVLSYAFWQRQFGGSASVLGSTLSLTSHPVEIIGVTPAHFTGIDVGHQFDVALPLCAEAVFDGKDNYLAKRWGWWRTAIGRLNPGWTQERVNAHLQALAPAVFEASVADWEPERKKNFLAMSLKSESAALGLSDVRETYNDPLCLLAAIAGVVLLIACANLANLLLARGSAREKEVAVRLAIGVARRRLIRQLLAASCPPAPLGAAPR